MAKTLKQFRKESGLTLSEIVEKMQAFDKATPRTHVGLIHIENRGTDRLAIIRALAHVYEQPFDAVAEAARNPVQNICSV